MLYCAVVMQAWVVVMWFPSWLDGNPFHGVSSLHTDHFEMDGFESNDRILSRYYQGYYTLVRTFEINNDRNATSAVAVHRAAEASARGR